MVSICVKYLTLINVLRTLSTLKVWWGHNSCNKKQIQIYREQEKQQSVVIYENNEFFRNYKLFYHYILNIEYTSFE